MPENRSRRPQRSPLGEEIRNRLLTLYWLARLTAVVKNFVGAHKSWVSSRLWGRLSSLPPAAGIQKWQAGKPAPHRVTPIDDTIKEGPETVTLAIQPNLRYTVGSPGSATLTIAD